MSKPKVILAFLLGAAAGAVAGVLGAPKSGKETRDDIREGAGTMKQRALLWADDMKQKANDYKQRAENAVESAKEELTKGEDKKS